MASESTETPAPKDTKGGKKSKQDTFGFRITGPIAQALKKKRDRQKNAKTYL